ncbi:MAG: beta-lactamase family protein [Fimbriimonadaceae bacterium]|nr:beta-lactamase family protein [Chthonomonadaceae bacterium]MCO5296267.1 beta-lactamase family protein [Fimbriimonadaceae bacterium]
MLASLMLMQGSAAPDLPKTVDARLQEAASDGFSGSVLVVHGGKSVLSKGYGFADPKAGRKVTPSTIFSIGSVTKWFTALVTLRLEQDGKLKLSDPIARLIDHVPADKRRITIEQLLAHTAGLGDYIDRPGEGGDFAKIDRATALKRILAEKLKFEPGTKTEYSNVGYTLLAMILEKASGQSYEECVRNLIFKPAGMARSGFFGDRLWPEDQFAIGQRAKTHGTRNMAYHWGPVTWSLKGAGGIVSTSEDLGKAVLALTQGKILSMANEPRMFRAVFEHEGYGWMVGRTAAGTPFCNVGGGDDFGFQAAILYMPHEGDLVITCSNSNTPEKMRVAIMDVLRTLEGG